MSYPLTLSTADLMLMANGNSVLSHSLLIDIFHRLEPCIMGSNTPRVK